MPEVRPFRGLLYSPGAGRPEVLTAPPYDVISAREQDRFHHASPYNVVRLILGKDEPGDSGSFNKYTRAASHLRTWEDQGILEQVDAPSIFPYELRFPFAGAERR